MMRSLYSGVAGLRTHQTKMDVIGNNIANVNTTAYKSQSVSFRDLMYQTSQNASGANAATGIGGTNAKQIGLGVTTGAINTNIAAQGSAQSTNNGFDIMITGDAFFVVSNGSENFFTRDGSFYVDGSGNLAMTSLGYNVMGWQVDPQTGEPKADTVSALRVMSDANMTYPPEATTEARITGIIDKNDTKVNSASGRIMNLEFYDNLGYKYTAKMSIHAASAAGQYYVKLDDILDPTGKSIGAAAMGDVTFGSPSLTVDVSEAYTPTNGDVTVKGNVTVNNAPAGTDSIAAQPINTEITVGTGVTAAALEKLYGIADATTINKVKFGQDGTLTIVDPVTISPSTYSPVAGASTTFSMTAVTVTDKNNAAQNFDFTPGNHAGTDNVAEVLAFYGLDLKAENVLNYTMGNDGTLTVTRKNVSNAANLVYNTGNGKFISVNGNGNGKMTMGFGGLPNFDEITLDFSTSQNVNHDGSSTVAAVRGTEDGIGEGRKLGEMSSIAIGKDGTIEASYDNGMSKCVGQIATAVFANASGLKKEGDNLYSATTNSGNFDGIGKDVTTNGGYMSSGVLEMSNVDLSSEFTEMITTQRGFQANSRIITVSDTMLEELTNLKR